MTKPIKTPKRLILNIDEELHMMIKRLCVEKRITISDWIKDAISKQLKVERDLGYF